MKKKPEEIGFDWCDGEAGRRGEKIREGQEGAEAT